MANKIILRRDTSANWTSVDPVLSNGEIGLETNTGKFKIGNGVTSWEGLLYYARADDIAAEYNGALLAAVEDAEDQVDLAAAQVALATAQKVLAAAEKTAAQTAATNAGASASAAAASAAAAAVSAAEASALDDEAVSTLIANGSSDTRDALDGAVVEGLDNWIDILLTGGLPTATGDALDARYAPKWPLVGSSTSRAALYTQALVTTSTPITALNCTSVPAGLYKVSAEVVFDRLFNSGDGATTNFRLGWKHAATTNNFQSGTRWFSLGYGNQSSMTNVATVDYPGYVSGQPTASYVDYDVNNVDTRFVTIQGLVQTSATGDFGLFFSPTQNGEFEGVYIDHASFTLSRIS